MELEQRSYDEFIRLPSIISLCTGHDPLGYIKHPLSRWLNKIYQIACIAGHAFCLYNMVLRIYEWDYIGNDVGLIIRYLIWTTFVVNSDTKFLTAMINRHRICQMNNELSALFPITKQERIAHRVNKYYCSRFLNYIIVIYFIACGLVVLGPLFQSFATYWKQRAQYGPDQAHFPYLPSLQFMQFRKTPWIYTGVYIVEWFHSIFVVVTSISEDMWLICFVNQICIHFDYIARSLMAYEPKSHDNKTDQEFPGRMVARHNKLLDLHKELNYIFSGPLVLNLIATVGITCTVSVYVLITGLGLEGLSYVLFIPSFVGQFYLVCKHGQRMIDLSTEIANAAYSQAWHKASTNYKKQLLLIMIRAQRPAELTAMGLLPISLDTFKVFLTVSYRTFAVLRTLIQK